MGFLDFIFRGKREEEAFKSEIDGLKTALARSTDGLKNDVSQIIEVLSQFDSDLAAVRESLNDSEAGKEPSLYLKNAISDIAALNSKNEKNIEELKKRMRNIEKIAAQFRLAGKLSVENYDALKSLEQRMKKLDKIDALEKNIREHISLTPEAIISKDEYSEEMRNLKRRLDSLEKSKAQNSAGQGGRILISSERKRAKKP